VNNGNGSRLSTAPPWRRALANVKQRVDRFRRMHAIAICTFSGPAKRFPYIPGAGVTTRRIACCRTMKSCNAILVFARCVIVQASVYGHDNRCSWMHW